MRTNADLRPAPPSAVPILIVGLLALFLIIVGGAYFYSSQEGLALSVVEDQLLSVASLKIQQIVEWNHDRIADCRSFMDDGELGATIFAWMTQRAAAEFESLNARLIIEERRENYRDMLLVDEDGRILMSLAGKKGRLEPESRALLSPALDRNSPMLSDLHRAQDGKLAIDAIAPLVDAVSGRRAAIVLRSDPAAFLYPLIQSWPAPSTSAETLLVRADGDSVLYLNELRQSSSPPLTIRLPRSRLDLPASMAVNGEVGIRSGLDYRGVRVLAALAPVPGTTWFIVSKMDLAEATAPWRSLARIILALLGALGTAALAVMGVLWQRSRLHHYRALYTAEQATTRAEAELRSLNAELERRVGERTRELETTNADLEAFVHNVSHDLRTPLRAIDGYAGLLFEEESSRLSEAGRTHLEQIRSGARRMGKLIDDLLEFARVGRIEMERGSIDMDRLVRSVLDELSPEYDKRRVDFVLNPLMPAAGDAGLLRQVWMNLIDNAIKFSSRRDRAEIEIGCERTASGIKYFVKDNGAGFDMRYRSKLFRVFQRLHGPREFGGTGVGLAIAQRVVERHGGSVDAVGSVGEGATVSFTLPALEV